jgi:UDP-2-acetamido-3-amino-2,3-dideoxy-glucuronate N-acetyltransferase
MVSVSDVRIAVIGCGHWGKNHVRNFHELGALAAICDADEMRAEAFSKQYNVPALTVKAIQEDPSIHAVVLATPAHTHGESIRLFLNAGKDILAEKPLCLDSSEGRSLVEQAKKDGRILMVGHILQYHGAFRKLREMVKSNAVGNLHYIQSNRRSHGKIRMEEDVWWSFAPHDISMILSLAGASPTQVVSQHQAIVQAGISDITYAHLQFESGLQAEINVSWINPFKEHCLTVIGDKGMLVFDDRLEWEQKIQYFQAPIRWEGKAPTANKQAPEYIEATPTEPLREECQHFIDCISSRDEPCTSGAEALAVLQVLEKGNIL